MKIQASNYELPCMLHNSTLKKKKQNQQSRLKNCQINYKIPLSAITFNTSFLQIKLYQLIKIRDARTLHI